MCSVWFSERGAVPFYTAITEYGMGLLLSNIRILNYNSGKFSSTSHTSQDITYVYTVYIRVFTVNITVETCNTCGLQSDVILNLLT